MSLPKELIELIEDFFPKIIDKLGEGYFTNTTREKLYLVIDEFTSSYRYYEAYIFFVGLLFYNYIVVDYEYEIMYKILLHNINNDAFNPNTS